MDDGQRLVIEAACRALVLRAAGRVDGADPAGLAELFAPDGVLVRPNAQPLRGRAEIAAAYSQRPADRITRHLVTNTLVSVESPTNARATSYVLLWTGSTTDEAGPQGRRAHPQRMVGEFDDEFVLESGTWFIWKRYARFVLHDGG